MMNTHDNNKDEPGIRIISKQAAAGKTSTAFALALHLAASENSFLIDSDDPRNEEEAE
jgi:hypothetical protein